MSSSLHPPHACLVWDIRGTQRDTWSAKIQEYKTIFMECDRTVVWFISALQKKRLKQRQPQRRTQLGVRQGRGHRTGRKGNSCSGAQQPFRINLSSLISLCLSPAQHILARLQRLLLRRRCTNSFYSLTATPNWTLSAACICTLPPLAPSSPDSGAEQRKWRSLPGDPWLFLVLEKEVMLLHSVIRVF